MSQGNSFKQVVSLPRLHHQCSLCSTKVGIQLLVLNCLNVGQEGNFLVTGFPTCFPSTRMTKGNWFFFHVEKESTWIPISQSKKKKKSTGIKGFYKKSRSRSLRIFKANVKIIFMTLEEFLHQNIKIANHKGKD